MTITAIRQQQRAKGRYSIYVDERYGFSLSADALLAEKVTVGQAIDMQQLKAYKRLSSEDKAYMLAISYVVRRQRSRGELADYFQRKGYDDKLRRHIMSKLERINLVDDERFAEAWVRNRRIQKPVSKRRLQQELRQKRIADETIERVLVEDEADERTVLRELIACRRKQSKYQDNVKLMQYLARQGFSYDDIKTALAEEP